MTDVRVQFRLESITATRRLGLLLGKALRPGDVLCLEGDLGTGKTTITQALAGGLGLEQGYYVNSPSFAILHEYPARIPLYHMDFYRLSGADEVLDMGLEEFFYGEGVTVIEWASKAAEILPARRLEIVLAHCGEEGRMVTITGHDRQWGERLRQVATAMKAPIVEN